MQNGFVESMRDECFNEHLFHSLRHARKLITAWRTDSSQHQPHASLAGPTPVEDANGSRGDQNQNRADPH